MEEVASGEKREKTINCLWTEGIVGRPSEARVLVELQRPPLEGGPYRSKPKSPPSQTEGGAPERDQDVYQEGVSGVRSGGVRISRAAVASSSRTRILKPKPDQATCSRIPPTVSA
jgi:hypothetical protein